MTGETTSPAPELTPEQADALVAEFAAILQENDPQPLGQIRRMVTFIGEGFVRKHLDNALKIEEEGGMMTVEGDRRRTIGGVFFYLVKGDMTLEQRAHVFPGTVYIARKATRTISWEERMDILEALKNAPQGNIRSVQLIIKGKPGEVKITDDTVMLVFHQPIESQPVQPYPRGVPAPPDANLSWVVYAGIRSWEKVAERLEHPKDEIIIDGIPFWDHETQTMAILAIGLTTRELERRQAMRQAGKQKPGDKPRGGPRPGGPRGPRPGGPGGFAPRPPRPNLPPPDVPESMNPLGMDVDVRPISSGPIDPNEKLVQLEQAADTLRERIAAKEAKGVKASMEQKLLQTTEKQIEALRKQAN
jgi:hypothetical protein